MRHYRCKQCKKKGEAGTQIRQGISNFCSKQCRLDFNREQNRKVKEKEKTKIKKARNKVQNSTSKLKKKLWTIVSLYIRLRDSDQDNYCICCTCGIKRHYKDGMQAGHYVPQGSSSYHKYNEKNIHSQCYGCNCGKGGNLIEYRPFMINKYGEEYVEWLFETRNTLTKYGTNELQDLIEQYAKKLEEVKQNKILD